MKIDAVETVRLDDFPNLLFVEVHTDEGVTGLGETFLGAWAVEAYIHESVAPYLLGRDPLQLEAHSRALLGYLGYASTGVEMRGNSAIDIALWDVFGKVTGQPISQLLGGASRDAIRVYNTCAGYTYVRAHPEQSVRNWGLPVAGEAGGPYEDLEAFLHSAGELALSLREQGIDGMKVWPFDPFAEETNGQYISSRDLEIALEPFRKIRDAVGSAMDVMVEFHSLWNLPTAKRIAEALSEFEPFWLEDPIRANNLDALEELARATNAPLALSETLATRWGYRELLERGIGEIVVIDIAWCGGFTEARKIAAMADTYQLPVVPHDCTGPVNLVAGTHLAVSAPNALLQEVVRAHYTSWYGELVTELPTLDGGFIAPPRAPGLGTQLADDLRGSAGVHVRASTSWDAEGGGVCEDSSNDGMFDRRRATRSFVQERT